MRRVTDLNRLSFFIWEVEEDFCALHEKDIGWLILGTLAFLLFILSCVGTRIVNKQRK